MIEHSNPHKKGGEFVNPHKRDGEVPAALELEEIKENPVLARNMLHDVASKEETERLARAFPTIAFEIHFAGSEVFCWYDRGNIKTFNPNEDLNLVHAMEMALSHKMRDSYVHSHLKWGCGARCYCAEAWERTLALCAALGLTDRELYEDITNQ